MLVEAADHRLCDPLRKLPLIRRIAHGGQVGAEGHDDSISQQISVRSGSESLKSQHRNLIEAFVRLIDAAASV
jgi:hypothetical protein